MQKARSLKTLVPSTRMRQRRGPKITNTAGNRNNTNGGQTNSNSNKKTPDNNNANNTKNRNDRRPGPVYPPFETSGKTNHSTEICNFRATTNRPPPRNGRLEGQNQVQQRNARNSSDVNNEAPGQTLNLKRHVFTPEQSVTYRIQLKQQNFHQFSRPFGSNPRRCL